MSNYLEEELSALQVISQDIQHPYHLGEDENSVASLLQTHQQLVQQNQLPTAADQLLSLAKRGKQLLVQPLQFLLGNLYTLNYVYSV